MRHNSRDMYYYTNNSRYTICNITRNNSRDMFYYAELFKKYVLICGIIQEICTIKRNNSRDIYYYANNSRDMFYLTEILFVSFEMPKIRRNIFRLLPYLRNRYLLQGKNSLFTENSAQFNIFAAHEFRNYDIKEFRHDIERRKNFDFC